MPVGERSLVKRMDALCFAPFYDQDAVIEPSPPDYLASELQGHVVVCPGCQVPRAVLAVRGRKHEQSFGGAICPHGVPVLEVGRLLVHAQEAIPWSHRP